MTMVTDWQPYASFEVMKIKARMLQSLRAFFSAREIMEVDTPILSAAATTEPHLDSFASVYRGPDAPKGRVMYLHTSPEFPMKRLLAAGSGPIYQVCKVFRQGEVSKRHNPEFTMLEWYRPHFDAMALMDEVEELVTTVLGEHIRVEPAERVTYQQAFQRYVAVDPFATNVKELRRRCDEIGVGQVPGLADENIDGWRDLLLSHVVQPQLGRERPAFLHDYPASQASMARVRPGPPDVAERFEFFIDGIELANGFHELVDAGEQRRRFESDRARRKQMGLRDVPQDERLLAAFEAGSPPCSGVALGLDRLVMLAAGTRDIAEVLSFPVDRA